MINTKLLSIIVKPLFPPVGLLLGLLYLGACSQSSVADQGQTNRQPVVINDEVELSDRASLEPSEQSSAEAQQPSSPSPLAADQVGEGPKQIHATTSPTGEYTEDEGYVGGFLGDGPITISEEIVFAPDETEKIIGGGTVEAETVHEYLFTSDPGQAITIQLQIEEGQDAAFQLQDRIGGFWSNTLSPYPAIAARHWSGSLPKSDGQQFRIVVGPTNGSDASYLMRIVME